MQASPLNSLPSELKTLIFNDLKTSLWSGRSVCKDWRDFLDKTPTIWEATYKQAGGNLSKLLPSEATSEQKVSILKRAIKIQYAAKKNFESATFNQFYLKIPKDIHNPRLTFCADKAYLLGTKTLHVYDLSQPNEFFEGKMLAEWSKTSAHQIYNMDHDTFVVKSDTSFELWGAQNEKKLIDVKDLKNDLIITYKNILAYNDSNGQMTFLERTSESDYTFKEVLKKSPVKGVSAKVSNKSLMIGTRFFTICQDGSLHIYDLEKKEKILNPDLAASQLQPIKNFKANEKYLAIWRKNAAQVEVFNLKTQDPLRSFEMQKINWDDSWYCPFQIYNDTLIGLAKSGIAADGAKTIYCWNLTNGALASILQCEHDIQELLIENGNLLIGYSASCIYVWDLNTFQQLSKMVFLTTHEIYYKPLLARIQDGILHMPYWKIKANKIDNQCYLGFWDASTGNKLHSHFISSHSKSNFHYPPRITEQPDAQNASQIVISDFSVFDAGLPREDSPKRR